MLLQRVTKGASAMTPYDALRMASEGGAKVLGFEGLGKIEPQMAADIAVFPVSGIEYTGVHDPTAGLIFSGISHRAKHVFVNGRQVVKNGRLVLAEEGDIREQAHGIAVSLMEKAHKLTGLDYLKSRT